MIALFSSKRALAPYDKVPTLKEVIGYDANHDSPQTAIGPPKMPKEIVDKLAKVIEGVANDSEYQRFLVERNAAPLYLPPDKARAYLDDLRNTCRSIMGRSGVLKKEVTIRRRYVHEIKR